MARVHHVAELTDEQAELAYPAMKELRPHLADAAELVERVRRQRAEGYRLVGSFSEDGSVAAVAGFGVDTTSRWGGTCTSTM
jgi:hypothetical protein